MSRRSPDALRKGVVANPAAPLSARLQALKEIKPTRRFLEHLLKADIPPRLHAEASRILLALPKKAKQAAKQAALVGHEPRTVETTSYDLEGRKIIDAELWDALCLGDPDATIPGCVRGPDLPETAKPESPAATPSGVHVWRDA